MSQKVAAVEIGRSIFVGGKLVGNIGSSGSLRRSLGSELRVDMNTTSKACIAFIVKEPA